MDQLIIHQIRNKEDRHFAEFWKVCSESFPQNERRTIEQQILVFEKLQYRVSAYLSENLFIGLIAYWTLDEFVFVEHFAIVPEVRNRRLGSAVLKLFVDRGSAPVILEIEMPTDNLTLRRLRFYESSGFVRNDHQHLQPPYHTGDQPLELTILSYPFEIDENCYRQFSQFQKNTIMA